METPKDMLGPIPPNAKIGRLKRNKLFREQFAAGAVLAMAFATPSIGDGVAQKQDIHAAPFGDFHKFIVATCPIGIAGDGLYSTVIVAGKRHRGGA